MRVLLLSHVQFDTSMHIRGHWAELCSLRPSQQKLAYHLAYMLSAAAVKSCYMRALVILLVFLQINLDDSIITVLLGKASDTSAASVLKPLFRWCLVDVS